MAVKGGLGSEVKQCAGYCKLHKSQLTVTQIKNRKCLSKSCWYLVKYSNHPWWQYRDYLKLLKKKRKLKERLNNG